MNIYFDYENNIHNTVISKYLSRLLTRIKSDILGLLEEIMFKDMRNEQQPKEGYILVSINPRGYSKKAFGFSDEIRKKIQGKLDEYNLENTIKNADKP